MSRFLSRKFIQSAAAEAALAGALVACLWRAELHPYLPYVVGALAAVAVGYGAANAWQRRGRGRRAAARYVGEGRWFRSRSRGRNT